MVRGMGKNSWVCERTKKSDKTDDPDTSKSGRDAEGKKKNGTSRGKLLPAHKIKIAKSTGGGRLLGTGEKQKKHNTLRQDKHDKSGNGPD